MSIANGTLLVTCSQCGFKHTFDAEEADFEITSSEERPMGTEIQRTWETTFDCDCGNEIEIIYDAWEYPSKVFQTEEIQVTGGKESGGFDFDFSEEVEPD